MGRHEKAALEPHRQLLLTEDAVDDDLLDKDNYDDTRAEMRATGHNAVSIPAAAATIILLC